MNIQPWQLDMLDKISSSGIKPGELMIISSGRRMGKSILQAVNGGWARPIKAYEAAGRAQKVDGEPWYTVKCTSEVGAWIRTLPTDLWYEHTDNQWYVYATMFDLHERVYIQLGLKFDQ
jgi:hypothetical protein